MAISSLLLLLAPGVGAGEVEVVAATARHEAGDRWRFDVTLRHDDSGWAHYADRWEVVTLEGEVLGTRVLLHPHVNEQPFTRSLGGVAIPAGTSRVRIRGHDSQHEWGGPELEVELKR